MNSLRDAANSKNVRMGKTLGIVPDATWWNLSRKIVKNSIFSSNILLVEEILHQLMLVVYPMIYRALQIPGVKRSLWSV